jgi:hypothetical protein
VTESTSAEAKLLIQLTGAAIKSKPNVSDHLSGHHAGDNDVAIQQSGNYAGYDDIAIQQSDHHSGDDGIAVPSDTNWKEFIALANHHAILPLLYDVLKDRPEVPEDIWQQIDQKSCQVVLQFYHLLMLTSYLVKLLEKEGILVAVLKGAAISAAYPIPELRKSGDIDLLFPLEEDFQKACEVLSQDGFRSESNMRSVYHRSFFSKEGIEIELHYHMSKPFDNAKVNQTLDQILRECKDHVMRLEVIGVSLPVLSPPYQAFYLLIHMLHHFLERGFGLKLLCDWVVFWNHPLSKDCKEKFLNTTFSAGLLGFARMVSRVCCLYLGLDQEEVAFLNPEVITMEGARQFMEEVMEAEEFGKARTERMVVLRGNGVKAYFREFHHQMLLNHKYTGKYPILWPLLWPITLVMFIYRNRKLRKVSTRAILQSARKRSSLLQEMELF